MYFEEYPVARGKSAHKDNMLKNAEEGFENNI